jgi:hypothetical protein
MNSFPLFFSKNYVINEGNNAGYIYSMVTRFKALYISRGVNSIITNYNFFNLNKRR